MFPDSLQDQSSKNNNITNKYTLQKDSKQHKHTVTQIIYLGIFFLLLTLTYSSFSTIITFIYEKQNSSYLGPLLLITNYGTFMLMNIIAPYIKISEKKQLIIGALCYTINYGLQIFNNLNAFGILLLILGSVLGGLGAAIVWVSQGGFMTKLFQKYQRPADHHGRYFALLNTIVFSNTLLGSIITTFALGFFGDFYYFMILTLIGALSVGFSTFLLQDVSTKSIPYQQFNQQKDSQLSNQISKSSENSQMKYHFFSDDMNITKSIISIYRFALKMKYFIPLIITDGLIIGFISATVTHLLPQEHYDEKLAGIFLVVLGFGAILGGYFSGYLCDKMPVIKVGKSSILALSFSIFLTLPVVTRTVNNLPYSLCLGLIWGFTWNYIEGWLWVCCSKIYKGKLQSFALNKFIHSLSFVVYQILLIVFGTKGSIEFVEYFLIFLVLMVAVSLFGLVREEENMEGRSSEEQ